MTYHLLQQQEEEQQQQQQRRRLQRCVYKQTSYKNQSTSSALCC
jgi:hypothetical protein